jgi:N6-L-threonylcarbamoyladenine synthase
MRILSIETSCDETALAILSVSGFFRPTFTIEAHKIATQIALHAQYGGVFPMMAKREHSRNIVPLFLVTLKEAGLVENQAEAAFSPDQTALITDTLAREPEMLELFLEEIPHLKKPDIDRIAVTVGPGLAPALWVGINFAKALSIIWNIPIVPVNHMEGHVLSVLVPKHTKEFTLSRSSFKLPALSLLVSGGHTELVLMKKIGSYAILGATVDDAAGEAFDKVARMLGLPYPGGPEISRLAEKARTENTHHTFKLPRPMIASKDFNFSFSGLKTAVLYHIRDTGTPDEQQVMEIAREFEDAACEVLVAKTMNAARKYAVKSIIVGGGVSANKTLAERLTAAAQPLDLHVSFPTRELSTDNAVMIALAGYFGKKVSIDSKQLTAQGNLSFKKEA